MRPFGEVRLQYLRYPTIVRRIVHRRDGPFFIESASLSSAYPILSGFRNKQGIVCVQIPAHWLPPNEFVYKPYMLCDVRSHRRGAFNRLMHPAEIVIRKMQRECCS